MSYAAVSKVGDNTLGNFLKIVSQNGVYSQLSEQSAMWANVLKRKKGPSEGRELRYLVRSTYGMAAAQFVGVSGAVAYPSAQQASISEGTAYYKDFALTVEVERTLIAKALSDMSRYGEPLAEELKAKTIGMARMLSAAAYQDGSGRIAEVSTATNVGATLVIVCKTGTDDIGHIGWIEYGDKLKCVSTAGAAQVPTLSSGTHAYFVVTSIDRDNDTFTVTSYDANDALLTISAANQVGAGDFFIRYGITANDYASISTNDYGTYSEAFVGLHSLAEDDGRKVNGLTLSGAIKGTRYSAGNNPIDSTHFQGCLSKVKVAVGEGAYSYKDALMAPEVLDALVESRETDRRFTTLADNTRGVNGLGYQHGKDKIIFASDEYCPKKRIYVLPAGDVLQFRGSDFEFVRPDGGQKFFLRPTSSGGHYRSVRAYMEGSGLLLCVHPQAIGVIDNFTY